MGPIVQLRISFIILLLSLLFCAHEKLAIAVSMEDIVQELSAKNTLKDSNSTESSDVLYAEVPIDIEGINEEDDKGFTILLTASLSGQYEELKNYIKAGANVNHSNAEGNSALHLSVRGGYYHCSKELINAGADLNSLNNFGVSPLILAISGGHYEIAVALLDAGANPNVVTGRDNTPALTIAAQIGTLRVIKHMLFKGATVDKRTSSGETALMFASAAGHTEIVRCLLEGGAKYSLKNSKGYTALIFAAARGQDRVMEAIISKNQHDIALRQEESMRIEMEQKINKKSYAKATTLVVDEMAKENVSPLVEDVCNHQDRYGRSALTHAIEGRHQRAIEILVERGAHLPESGFRVDQSVMERRYEHLQSLHDEQQRLQAKFNAKRKKSKTKEASQ